MHVQAEVRTFIKVYVALMILLGLTYFLAYQNLGKFNFFLALAIAIAKACLVGAFFMELRKEIGLMRIAALGGVYWLMILVSLTLADYLTRDWIPLPGAFPQAQNVEELK